MTVSTVGDFEKQMYHIKNNLNMKDETTQTTETPMADDRVLAAAVKSDWDLRKCFEQLRFDKNHHLGLGDMRLTIAQQDEICELVERFYRCR